MIKAILLDADNTLFRRDKSISPDTFAALKEASGKGVRIGIASGRSICSVKDIATRLGFKDMIYSAFNGNLVADDQRVYCDRPLDEEAFDIASAIIRDRLTITHTFGRSAFLFQGSEEWWNVWRGKLFKDEAHWGKFTTYKEMSTIVGDNLYHIFAREKDDELRLTVEKEVRAALEGKADVICSSADNFEIFPLGTDKGNTVDILIKELGYRREEIMTFGDWDNDLGMTERAGIGVAMGNACDRMKKVADYVTLDCDEDGIPYALKHFGVID